VSLTLHHALTSAETPSVARSFVCLALPSSLSQSLLTIQHSSATLHCPLLGDECSHQHMRAQVQESDLTAHYLIGPSVPFESPLRESAEASQPPPPQVVDRAAGGRRRRAGAGIAAADVPAPQRLLRRRQALAPNRGRLSPARLRRRLPQPGARLFHITRTRFSPCLPAYGGGCPNQVRSALRKVASGTCVDRMMCQKAWEQALS